jgi:MFS family permease
MNLPRPLRHALSHAVGGLSPVFWYLWAGTLVNRLGSFVMPFMSLYLTQGRHLSVADAGLIVSLYGVGSGLAGPLGGALADRIGRRSTLLLALGVGGLGTMGLGFVRPLWGIALLTFAVGLVTDLARPAVFAAVTDVVDPEQRPHAFGLLYWAINLGFSLALVLAGFLAMHGYLLLFVGDGLTTLAYAVIVFLRVPETGTRRTREEHRRAGGMGTALRDPVLMAFVFLSFLLGCVFQQSVVGLPLDLAAHGFPPSVYGTLLATNGVMIILVQPFSTRPLKRFPRAGVLAASGLLTGLGFGWNAFATTAPVFGLGIGVWTAGEIMSAAFSPAIVSDLAPAELRGRYQGLYSMSWGAAAFAGPAMGAELLSRYGARTLWTVCALVGVAIAVGHLAIAPARRRRLTELGLAHAEDAAR